MRRVATFIGCLILMLGFSVQAKAQCVPGTVSGITAVCGVQYSQNGSPLNSEPRLVYDVFYQASYGPANNLPIIIFWHAGAYRQLAAPETGSQSVFSTIAGMGYNVYVPSYSLTGMGVLVNAITPGQTVIAVHRNGGGYFPQSATVNYMIQVDGETMTVVGQVVTVTIGGTAQVQWNLTLANPVVSNHAASAFTYVLGTQWPRPGNDGARFLAFLGHNAGQTVPGNPQDIRLWGFSAGSHLTLMQETTGNLLFPNDGEFSLADFENAHITRVVAMSPPADEGCVAILASDGSEPFAVASLIGEVPQAQSVSSLNCTATNPNAAYIYARSISPVAYATPSNPSVPTLILTGGQDTDVTPAPAAEFMSETAQSACSTGTQNTQQTIYPTFGHLLDLFIYSPNQAGMSMQSTAVQASVAFLQQ